MKVGTLEVDVSLKDGAHLGLAGQHLVLTVSMTSLGGQAVASAVTDDELMALAKYLVREVAKAPARLGA